MQGDACYNGHLQKVTCNNRCLQGACNNGEGACKEHATMGRAPASSMQRWGGRLQGARNDGEGACKEHATMGRAPARSMQRWGGHLQGACNDGEGACKEHATMGRPPARSMQRWEGRLQEVQTHLHLLGVHIQAYANMPQVPNSLVQVPDGGTFLTSVRTPVSQPCVGVKVLSQTNQALHPLRQLHASYSTHAHMWTGAQLPHVARTQKHSSPIILTCACCTEHDHQRLQLFRHTGVIRSRHPALAQLFTGCAGRLTPSMCTARVAIATACMLWGWRLNRRGVTRRTLFRFCVVCVAG
eukprot:1144311-Pelagomonas_calceolata.AAC.6